jgi:hypothetical protein
LLKCLAQCGRRALHLLRFVPQAFVGLRQLLRTDFKAAVAQRQITLVLAVRVVHLSQQLGQARQYRLKVGRHIGSVSQISQQRQKRCQRLGRLNTAVARQLALQKPNWRHDQCVRLRLRSPA